MVRMTKQKQKFEATFSIVVNGFGFESTCENEDDLRNMLGAIANLNGNIATAFREFVEFVETYADTTR